MRGAIGKRGECTETDAVPWSVHPQLHDAWTRAALGTNQADPFCCAPAWQLSFHDAFSPERRLLIRESSGNVLVFAEKVFSPDDVVLTPIEPHWFFGCPLLGKGAVDMLADAMGSIERQYHPSFPRIIISGIRPGGVLERRLLRTFASTFQFFLFASGVQCAASLAGGVDGYLSRRSGNHRRKLRKQARRVGDLGIRYERVSPCTPWESEHAFARMLAVELKSWKGLEQCGMDQEPATSFYRIMMARLSRSKDARVIFARHEGEDIGYIFGGMAGRIYRGQQFSYAEPWRRHAIGNLLQMEQIRWLTEERAVRYDMGPLLGEKMGYKAHWTEREIPLNTWAMLRR